MQLSAYLFTDIRGYHSQYAMSGFTERPTGPAYSYAAILPFFLSRHKFKTKNFVPILMILIFSIASFRRSAFISVAIASITVITYIIFQQKNKIIRIRALMMLLSVIISVFLVLNYTQIGQDFIMRLQELNPELGGTASGRYLFWPSAISIFIERDIITFLFGSGLPSLIQIMYYKTGIMVGTHNLFLDVALTLGVVGLIILFYFFYKFFIIVIKAKGNVQICMLTAIIILVTIGITTGAGFSPDFLPLFALVGYSIAEYQQKKNMIYGNVKNYFNLNK
jgi:O-antigen ligase